MGRSSQGSRRDRRLPDKTAGSIYPSQMSRPRRISACVTATSLLVARPQRCAPIWLPRTAAGPPVGESGLSATVWVSLRALSRR